MRRACVCPLTSVLGPCAQQQAVDFAQLRAERLEPPLRPAMQGDDDVSNFDRTLRPRAAPQRTECVYDAQEWAHVWADFDPVGQVI
jgi:hypothetical protein